MQKDFKFKKMIASVVMKEQGKNIFLHLWIFYLFIFFAIELAKNTQQSFWGNRNLLTKVIQEKML